MAEPKETDSPITGTEHTVSGSFRLDYSSDWSLDDFRTRSWKAGVLDRKTELTKQLHPTLLHALVVAAKVDEGKGVVVLDDKESEPDRFVTYKDLYEDARRIAQGLSERGVGRGDRVLLVLPTGHEFLLAFFAVQMVGAIPAPAYPPAGFRIETGLDRLAHIARHSGSKVCITFRLVQTLLGEVAHKAPTLERVVTVDELRSTRLPKLAKTKASDPAFIQYTSGSTGNPKGVLLSHGNLVTNIHAMGQALRINHDDVLVGWCPLYHDMGLIGTFLSAVYWRLPLVLLSPMAFLTKPRRWLRAISKYKGTISPAPNFGYALAVKRTKPEDREGLDLSSWRVALNGAEPVTMNTVREFTKTYEPFGFQPTAMFPVYGLAESSLAVSFPDPGTPVKQLVVDREHLAHGRAVEVPEDSPKGISLVCCGKAVPGHSVRVLDERGRDQPPCIVGRVITTGGSVMQGYFENPEATAECLKDGWLDTGDLGFVREGELYITGRAKDLIIVRGKNYYAEDIERYAEKVEGIRAGGCVAFGVYDEQAEADRVVIVAETKLEGEEAQKELAQKVSEVVVEGVGIPVDEVVIVPPSTIPKTSSGKRQRRRTREAYLAGQLVEQSNGKWRMGLVYVRSQTGFVLMSARRVFGMLSRSK
ncbi:MAG: fatty acyl-AMP ligase [Polyangiales bacterium]